ncbi:RNA-binding protein [Shewanella avicenniae]|uniref:RNA-binding protein n=1 Tax=Shewanella avicenniae TaxID=2814294 RepID=A0ABX7QPU6_9GAMM|nr:RNA-binding protein [Shewanella avicenniae]QSX33498.1 RNA-binding protein [Shewanella avicenniae]
MQKSLLVVALIAALGALAIAFLAPALPAYIAFVIGALASALVFVALPTTSNSGAVTAEVAGPMTTLYVGNLPYRANEAEVKTLFEQYGAVNSVRLVRDRKTGRRKGFGFVEITEDGAKKALSKLNDAIFQERTLKVREAKSQDAEAEEK